MIPSLFVAHGSPMIAIEDTEYARYLENLGRELPRPRAIVVFSAHWLARVQTVSDVDAYLTIHDFGGFPEELFHAEYPAKGDRELSARVRALLAQAGIRVQADGRRGLDHGAWTILSRLYPDADIPVVAMSIDPALRHEEQYRVGRALAPLRGDGILVVGSGVTVHNFRAVDFRRRDAPVAAFASEFEEWLEGRLAAWDLASLFAFEALAPHARMAAPEGGDEHFAPIFYALGAADDSRRSELLHRSFEYGSLSNSVYAFGQTGAPPAGAK